MKMKNWHLSRKGAARHCNNGIFDEISKYTVSTIMHQSLFIPRVGAEEKMVG